MKKRKNVSTAPEPPMLLTIPEVAARLNIGRTKVYTLIKQDGLPVVKLGAVTRVPLASLQRWLEQHEQAS